MAKNKVQKKRKKLSVKRLIITIVLGAFVILMLFPLLWMLSASFKLESEVFTYPIQWITKNFSFNNYKEVLGGRYNFLQYYWNTIKVTVCTVILQVVTSCLAAYAFARLGFRFKNGLFALYLATMMIPAQVTLVPRFLIVNWMGLYDTHIALILMGAFGSVYGVFLLRQSMVSIPDSIIESARLDGAGHGRIFTRIVVPMTQPAIVTLVTMRFVWEWNEYQDALVFLRTRSKYTLQIGMKAFSDQMGTRYALLMAASVLAILPMFLVFCVGQKSMIEGIATGAVKG